MLSLLAGREHDAPRTSPLSGREGAELLRIFILLLQVYAPSWEKSVEGEKVNVNNRFRLDSNLKQV